MKATVELAVYYRIETQGESFKEIGENALLQLASAVAVEPKTDLGNGVSVRHASTNLNILP